MFLSARYPEGVDQVIVFHYKAQNKAVNHQRNLVIRLQEIPNEYR